MRRAVVIPALLLAWLTAPVAALQAPVWLEAGARSPFESFLDRPGSRAFALGEGGAWGMAYDHETRAAAERAALAYCRQHADQCVVIAADDELLTTRHPFAGGRADGEGVSQLPAAPASASELRLPVALGLVVLLLGTLLAERFPLMLVTDALHPKRRKRQELRINYSQVAVTFVYLTCMMPVFRATAPAVTTEPLGWLWFGAPFLPLLASTLWLKARGRLAEWVE
ncbi:MAG: hypothetical protein U5R48_09110 [Gammaproteobacteria bacterium]|nr:hypothetical protein [Gammaproteobacteria bacterium]